MIVLPAGITRDQLLEACRVLGITVPDMVTRVTMFPDRVVVDWVDLTPFRENTMTLQVQP